jgi:hypothetical protein
LSAAATLPVFEPFGGASGSDVGNPLIFDDTEITPGQGLGPCPRYRQRREGL